MSNSNEGATIDSLCTFNYKKKFSFSRKISEDTSDKSNSDDSASSDTDIEELREKNLNWKGTAKLKGPNTVQCKSSSDEEATKKKKKK